VEEEDRVKAEMKEEDRVKVEENMKVLRVREEKKRKTNLTL